MIPAISHISWPPEAEEEALGRLAELGIDTLEVAPRRAFGDPLTVTESEVRERADWYRERGFSVAAFQAILFGSDGLELFGAEESRQRMKDLLVAVGRVAGWCGAGPMVFGSPKNRLRGAMAHSVAMKRAAEFFREVGDVCAEAGSCLVMEANPEAYGADFCVRLSDAAELVELADSPGFRLHVDAGGLALSGEDFEPVVRQAAGLIVHAHASQPMLAGWDEPDAVQARMVSVLKEVGYDGLLSIEMRQQENVWAGVETAIAEVSKLIADRGSRNAD